MPWLLHQIDKNFHLKWTFSTWAFLWPLVLNILWQCSQLCLYSSMLSFLILELARKGLLGLKKEHFG